MKMDKLIKLLNEHRKEINGDGKRYIDTDNYNMLTLNNLDKLSSELWVISKEYGFIKWLVDNDKIDRPKVWLKVKDLGDEYGWFGIYSGIHIECLLMLLAIQDEPIKFLTEILKTERQYTKEEQELIDLDYGTGYTKKFVK